MSEQPVIIPHDGEFLAADLCLGGSSAVVILPGWGGTRYGPQRILVQMARALATQGLTTLRLDFRGRGDSTGDAATVTLDEMIADACAAVAWLTTAHGIRRVHLVGLCSGGNVALGAASLLPEVEHVVCWSLLPFMEHKEQAAPRGLRLARLRQVCHKALRPEAWRKLFRGEANIHGAMRVVVRDKEGDAYERRRKTSQRDILAALTPFTGRLHLLYGSRDPEAATALAYYTHWCKTHRIPIAARVIPGAPHNFYTAHWTAEVVEQTSRWLLADHE